MGRRGRASAICLCLVLILSNVVGDCGNQLRILLVELIASFFACLMLASTVFVEEVRKSESVAILDCAMYVSTSSGRKCVSAGRMEFRLLHRCLTLIATRALCSFDCSVCSPWTSLHLDFHNRSISVNTSWITVANHIYVGDFESSGILGSATLSHSREKCPV